MRVLYDSVWLGGNDRADVICGRIHKEKYMTHAANGDDGRKGRSVGRDRDGEKEKMPPRDKSRARTIFGSKKKIAAT